MSSIDELRDLILTVEEGRPSASLSALLFGLVSGENGFIEQTEPLRLIVSLFATCSPTQQKDWLRLLTGIAGKCLHNGSECAQLGLLTHFLDCLPATNDELVSEALVAFLETLSSYTVTTLDARMFLRQLCSNEEAFKPRHYPRMLKSLGNLLSHPADPRRFWSFSGLRTGVLLPPVLKWPYPGGYTVSIWVRAETFGALGLSPEPRLYSFMTAKGAGFDAHFSNFKMGTNLTVRSVGPTGSISSATFSPVLRAQTWYHIVVVHQCIRIGTSEVTVYIQGEPSETQKVKYPEIIEPLTFNAFLTNVPPEPSRLTPFHALMGQMGPAMVFEDVITAQQVRALLELGPDIQTNLIPTDDYRGDPSIFTASMSRRRFVAVHPAATRHSEVISQLMPGDGASVLGDAPPVPLPTAPDPSNPFEATRGTRSNMDFSEGWTDRRIGGYLLTARSRSIGATSMISALAGIGGVRVIFPFFAQLDQPLAPMRGVENQEQVDYSIDPVHVTRLFTIMATVLRRDALSVQYMAENEGFLLLSFLLHQISPEHLSDTIIAAIDDLVKSDETLRHDAIRHLLLNLRLWIYAPFPVQMRLISLLGDYVNRYGAYFRQNFGVQALLDTLRDYYWTTEEDGESLATIPFVHPITMAACSRPSTTEIAPLRSAVLRVVKDMVTDTIYIPEFTAFVRFLIHCKDTFVTTDVLRLLLVLVEERPIAWFQKSPKDGMECMAPFFLIADTENETIRILAIKIIGKLLVRTSASHRATLFKRLDLAAVLESKLVGKRFTRVSYNAILELVLGNVSVHVTKNAVNVESGSSIQLPQFLGPLFRLTASSDVYLRERCLQDFLLLLGQGDANMEAYISQPGWQTWILAVMAASEQDEYSNETEVIFELGISLMRAVIYPRIVRKQQGVVEEAVAVAESFLAPTNPRMARRLPASLLDALADALNDSMAQVESSVAPAAPSAAAAAANNPFFPTPAAKGAPSSPATKAPATAPAAQPAGPAATVVNGLRETCANLVHLLEAFVFYPGTGSVSSPSTDMLAGADELLARDPRTGRWDDYDVVSKVLGMFDRLCSGSLCRSSPPPPGFIHGCARAITQMTLTVLIESSLLYPSTQQMAEMQERVDQARVRLASVRGSTSELAATVHSYLASAITSRAQSLSARSTLYTQAIARTWLMFVATNASDANQDKKRQEYLLDVVAHMLWTVRDAGVAFDIQSQIISFVRGLFGTLKQIYGPLLVDETGKSLLTQEVLVDSAPELFVSLLHTPSWQAAVTNLSRRATDRRMERETAVRDAVRERRRKVKEDTQTAAESLEMANIMAEKRYVEDFGSLPDFLIGGEAARRKTARDRSNAEQRASARLWRSLWRELTAERGCYGEEVPLNKRMARTELEEMEITSQPMTQRDERVYWRLDDHENSLRMRVRLVRNYEGTPHNEAVNQSHVVDDTDTASLGGEAYNVKGVHMAAANMSSMDAMIEAPSIEEELTQSEAVNSFGQQEQVLLTTSCSYVTPVVAIPGTFTLTGTRLSFILDLATLKPGTVVPPQCRDRQWSVEDITGIAYRRYLLRNTALEFFFADKSTALFDFPAKTRQKLFSKVTGLRPPQLTTRIDVSGAEAVKKARLTERWLAHEISNFEYLMQLNTMAGRTYNDMTQYPVFPWILSDYNSAKINLSDPSTFRDLSKPMGAQNPERLAQFLERYEHLASAGDGIPPFHYGSHYSSIGAVLHYLLRMEPFTTYFIQVNGRFDHADRSFDSIAECYHNVMTSVSDVKELIPEFFYLPEFLLNSNGFNLGTRQNGHVLNDVKLPPWAASPEDFIRLHREALECDYVSTHLHEWIDLIFGFKQRGQAAKDANNVFYYMTYEGAVDLDALTDPVERQAAETVIANFGQIPSQLFTKPHPRRPTRLECFGPPRINPSALDSYLMSPTEVTHHAGGPAGYWEAPIAYISQHGDHVVTLSSNRAIFNHRWKVFGAENTATSFQLTVDPLTAEREGRGAATSILPGGAPIDLRVERHPDEQPAPPLCAVIDEGRVLVSVAFFGHGIQCTDIPSNKLRQSIPGPFPRITALAGAENGTIVAVGCDDGRIFLFGSTPRARTPLSMQPTAVLYGHVAPVTCISVAADLDLVVSGSADGSCLLHTALGGACLRSLLLPARAGIPTHVQVSNEGRVVVATAGDARLRVFSINGPLRRMIDTPILIYSMTLSADSKVLFLGLANGVVEARALFDLRVVASYNPLPRPVTCLAATRDGGHLLVGLTSGHVAVAGVNTRAWTATQPDDANAAMSSRGGAGAGSSKR